MLHHILREYARKRETVAESSQSFSEDLGNQHYLSPQSCIMHVFMSKHHKIQHVTGIVLSLNGHEIYFDNENIFKNSKRFKIFMNRMKSTNSYVMV